LFQVQREVSCISQGDLLIASYFNKDRKVWDEFAAIGGLPRCDCSKCEYEINAKLDRYAQEQKITQFLMGLNESYTSVRGNILMMTPFPSLSQIYSLLVQEERQRQVRQENQFQIESASFNASSSNNNDVKALPGRKSEGKRPHLYCEHCKRTNHTIEKCYKLHGYPNNRQGARSKNLRTANSAWGEQSSERDSSEAAPSLPGLSQEQSKQLMQFLTNLTAGNE